MDTEENIPTDEQSVASNTSTSTTKPTPILLKTKDELMFSIREWLKIENEIQTINKNLKEKKNKMKELTNNLVNTMKVNSIDCFNIKDGALVYKKRTTKKQISGKFLLTQLEEYFKDQPDIAKELHKKVWDSRDIVCKEELCKQQKDKGK